MHFNFFSALSLLAVTGCAVGPGTASLDPNTNIVGKPISNLAAMNDTVGLQHTDIALFDKNVRVIHEFDLTSMSVKRSMTVENPDDQHSLIFDSTTGLIADFSRAHMTLFDRASNRYRDPVKFVGQPKSAAYDPVHGVLIVYDDMNSVVLIQTDANGAPLTPWIGGPVLQDDATLVSGDLMTDGSLVLSLSTGDLARVNVAASLLQRKWIFTIVSPGLGSFSWLAPVRGFTDRVLGLTNNGQLALISLNDGSVLASQQISSTQQRIVLESKSKDAHVVTSDSLTLTAWYTDGTKLHSRRINAPADVVLSSRLCLDQDSWTIVKASPIASWTYTSNETEFSARQLSKFRLSDSLGLSQTPLPDKAQLDISEMYIFALYPTSPFGYAERISMTDGSVAVIKMFNVGYIHN